MRLPPLTTPEGLFDYLIGLILLVVALLGLFELLFFLGVIAVS